jgi:uncharacterized membrane protein
MAIRSRPVYHRWMSAQAPALRRLAIDAGLLLIVALAAWPFVTWPVALLIGWNAGAVAFLAAVLPVIARANGPRTEALATHEDETRQTARLLVQASCGASLVAVVFALGIAKDETSGRRALLIAVAIVTVIVSWTVVNSVFTLRYADLFYRAPGHAIDFGETAAGQPDYRDFAYLAFTIGMTYQVSDTTLHDRILRRTVLTHAFVSYFFGVVIVAAGVNVVAGLAG